ncbi:hypothetical protein [Hymenobacter terricola]|uniref:hypothetical protein n=1 Tax=Hymenobacter terricola TaxID=2819236 RepID=UPI001B30F4A0|nr:hypothetical protein [Hymenobacter terricola]
MTRATLLHVLDRPTALGPVEVRELEQLAQAFPYCQTAHLLLAKAAHDQGTMLAGQRLRRAATYAADRALLRRLIEQVEPAAEEPAPSMELPASAKAQAPPPLAVSAPAVAPIAEAPEPDQEAEQVEIVAAPAMELATSASAPVEVLVSMSAMAAPTAFAPEIEFASTETEAAVAVIPTAEIAEEMPQITKETEAPEAAAAPQIPEADLPLLVDQEGVQIPAAEAAAEILPEPEAETAAETEQDLPAQAPAVRPPVEVGEARFEFGLAETPPASAPAYELPGLVDEWAAAAVTLSMGSPALLTPAKAEEAWTAPIFTPAAFTGDEAVGYAFGESSRLGFSMQLLNLLAAKAENAECTSELTAAAQPPAVALPPAGAFFEPDPLLLAHWAAHCPPPPAVPSSLDLINNFLRRQPRLSRPAMLPPSPAAQADLSARSTRAEPNLVSESLARILVRQGKTARAIEIYEKLMVKQPEKMAYFAAQIQQLQPSA